MAYNNILKKAQGNAGMAPAKEKRALSPCSGSDEEASTPKRKKFLHLATMSLSPADSVTSPTSYEKRTDESSESPSTPRARYRRRRMSGTYKDTVDLQSILQTNYKMLKEQMEPTELSEKLQERGILDYNAIDNIQRGTNRETRNDILIKALCKKGNRENIDFDAFLSALEQSGQSKIVRELANRPSIYKVLPGNTTKQGNTAVKQEDLVSVGSPLHMKLKTIPITTFPVQSRNEHDDPVTALQRKKEQIKEIENRIVAGVNENQEQLAQLFEKCISEFNQIKFSCIKIYMKALSKGSLGNLVAYSRSGAAKRLFLSLIDEETKRKLIEMNAKVVVEIYKGCKDSVDTAPLLTDCLCNLDKETVTRNFTPLMKGMRGSRRTINRFLEIEHLDDKTKVILEEIHNIKEIEERNEKLLQILLQKDLPKVFFCTLEEEIINHGGEEMIRDVIKDKSTESGEDDYMALTKSDIRNNKALLREELEARWFIRRLEKKKDRVTEALVENILASGSREERVDSFLEYLLKQSDFTWFLEELRTRNKHLLNTLIKKTGKDGIFDNLEVSRLKQATRFYIDDIIEEVDPISVYENLREKTKQELVDIKGVQERRKRATQFCLSLLRASQSVFCEVLHAMTVCGYKEIVEDIMTLAKDGPLNSRYKCAQVQDLNCNESCIFKQDFVLAENDSREKIHSLTSAEQIPEVNSVVIIADDSDSEDDCKIVKADLRQLCKLKDGSPGYVEIFDSSPGQRKLSRKSLAQSAIGESESGIFSGSGVCTEDINTDDESDYEYRRPKIDKRRSTKEWIDSHSESDLFGITTVIGGTTVAPSEEGRNNLQEDKGFLKQKDTNEFIVPLEKIRTKLPR